MWVIAPDAESLTKRWKALISAPAAEKDTLFHPTLRDGVPSDRHIDSVINEALPHCEIRATPLSKETSLCESPTPYAFRSFDRQWIIPDLRVITQANAQLWASRSNQQVYITALTRTSPSNGAAITLTGLVPDQDHYKGSFSGRVFPLWRNREATDANLPPALLPLLAARYGQSVQPEQLIAYLAAIAAHPAYTQRFQADLSTPGLRIPLTADAALFTEAVALGSRVVWLHSFGERMADADAGRPPAPPRLPVGERPQIPMGGEIPQSAEHMPDTIGYDASQQRLLIGSGHIERVPPAVWAYEVSGKQVLVQWFSYRKKNRERPLIGDRRPPSSLGLIQPDHWLAEYTTELLNLLNVLALLVAMEPPQATMLEAICTGALLSDAELKAAGVARSTPGKSSKQKDTAIQPLF